jgi:hypothetical protein
MKMILMKRKRRKIMGLIIIWLRVAQKISNHNNSNNKNLQI